MRIFVVMASASVVIAATASVARADPCKAIPDHGPMPAYLARGATFSGQVPYVGDGDSLCVALGPSPKDWVEVRLADFYAPELKSPDGPAAKARLETLVRSHQIRCVSDHQSYDRVVALCTMNGRPLGDLMRAAGVPEGGRGYGH